MYLGAGFLVLQGAELLVEVFQLPQVALTSIGVVVVLGLPVALALGWVFDASSEGVERTLPADSEDPSDDRSTAAPKWLPLPILVAFLALLAAGAVAGAAVQWLPVGAPEAGGDQPFSTFAAQLQVELPPGVVLPLDTEHPVLVVSPDGSRLVFVGEEDGRRHLYVRALADSRARMITGTEGASAPFISPEGEWIGFFEGAKLKRVAIAGGAPATPPTVHRGAAWVSGATLVYAPSANGALERGTVSDDRIGAIDEWELVTSPEPPAAWPAAVPGGTHLLFAENAGSSPRDARVAIVSIESGERRVLLNGGMSPRFSRSGHLLFTRGSGLHAVPFDASSREVTGPEQELLVGVMSESNGAAHYSVGGNGVLAYVAGEFSTSAQELVWVGRDGQVVSTLHEGRTYATPRLSPDGTRVALAITEGTNLDIWTLDLVRGPFSRVTSHPGEDFDPVWSPDGSALAFSSEIGEDEGDQGPALAWIREFSGEPEILLRTTGPGSWEFPTSWSPDGLWLAFLARRVDGTTYVGMLPPGDPEGAVPLIDTPHNVRGARFSPDGRWIAAVSDETGRDEVYVRPFEGPGPSIQISTGGGSEPVWSRNWSDTGGELFYRAGNDLMVVDLTGPEPTAERPRRLFTGQFEKTRFGGEGANYDVSADGERFLMVRRTGPRTASAIHVVLDWPAVLLD